MYLDHFGLQTKPFSLSFEPLYYYAASHQEATNDLCYSIEERQGLATLVGQPGTGKTTLLKNLLKSFDANIRGFFVSDVSLGAGSLLRQLMTELALPALDDQTLPLVLRSYLQNWSLLGRTLVLLVDEAQSLSASQLEEVRYLTNLELQGKKLIEIVLAGQPSLESRLASRDFEALRQRIAVRTYLHPMSIEHTSAYIQRRLETAGAPNPRLFDATALRAVQRRSAGIPRLINLICDRALLLSYTEDAHAVDASWVEKAADELGIDDGASTTTREPTVGRSDEPATRVSDGDVEARLSAIERKLDIILDAMAIAGLLSVEDEASVEDAALPTPSGTAVGEQPRIARFPRRRGKTS